MKTFDIKEGLTAVCEYQKTRPGFRHVAVLIRNGEEVERTKVCYLNRTWESYEYETVLRKLLEKTTILTAEEKTAFFERGKRKSEDDVKSMMRTTANIAALGEIFGTTPKEKNDWKARMLKAGINGLNIPQDWETLTEAEREKRLDAVISVARGE